MTTSATAKSKSKADAEPRATYVVVSDTELAVTLEDGRRVGVPIEWYPRLVHATPAERNHWDITGPGWGIHWPDLDEDIHVGGLLDGKRSGEGERSFQRWLAQRARGERPTLDGMTEDFRREDAAAKKRKPANAARTATHGPHEAEPRKRRKTG